MDIRKCKDCREYKYIEKDGLCRDCCGSVAHRFSEYDLSYDPTDIISPTSNQFSFGKIGSGKTVANKIEIMNILAERDDTTIYVTDPLGHYSDFVSELGGSEYVLDPDDAFNIFDIGKLNKVSQFGSKMSRIYDLIVQCFQKLDYSINTREKQLLQILIEQTYKENGVNQKSKNLSNLPTYSDMLDIAKKIQSNPSIITRPNAGKNQVKRLKSSMKKMYTRLDDIKSEFDLDYDMKANYTGDDLVYFNMSGPSGTKTPVKMRMIFNQVWEYSLSTTDKVVFYVDNAKYLLGNATATGSFGKCIQHSRHYDTSLCFSMAGAKDVIDTPHGRKIMNAIERYRIHRQELDSNRSNNQLNLSDKDLDYIKNASVGTNGNHSEVLIHDQGQSSREKIKVDDSLISDIH